MSKVPLLVPALLSHGPGIRACVLLEDYACVCVFMCGWVSAHTHQEDISAKLQDAVHTGQLLKHDGVRYFTEEASHKFPND